ncbi:hypothetical protein [Nocardia cyriacigeorgica]
MKLEKGTLVLGKLSFGSRGTRRMEPLSVRAENVWESAERDAFQSSLPLKVPNDLQADNGAPVIAELAEAPKLPGKKPGFLLSSARAANVVIDRRTSRPDHRVVEEISELALPRWANNVTEIFVLCEGDLLLGPLRVARTRRKISAPHPEKLEVRRSASMVVTQFDGWTIGDHISRLPVVDHIDCRPVDELLDDVADLAVKTLTSLDPEGLHIESTKQTLAKVRDWITERPGSGGDSLNSHRVERALHACDDAEAQRHLASRVANTLTGLPSVVAQMDRAIEEARANAERSELVRIENRVVQETERLATLEKDVHAAESRLRQLSGQIDQARQELVTAQEKVNIRNEELRGEVAFAVEELVNGTRERLASSIIAQALISHSTPAEPANSPSPIALDLRPVAKPVLAARDSIRRQLIAAAKASGMKATAAQRLFAAFSAGLLPITLGNGGPASLSAIAKLIFSGRVARIPVAHDFLNPADLLGLNSSKPGAYRTHHGVLEAANSEAAAGEVLVVLEGLNQAPTESYLVPWLQSCWEDTGFPSLQPHPNLKVAGTVATGITSARISPDLWGHAIVVDLPSLPTWLLGNEFAHVEFPETTKPAGSDVVNQLLTDVEPLWPFSEDIVAASQRFAAALDTLQTVDQIHRSVAECILLPAGATSLSEREYEVFVAALARNIALPEEAEGSYYNLAKRLWMRLT